MRIAKKSSLLQWEKVLKVMLSGNAVNRESLEVMPEMKDVPLYRLSTFIWRIKMTGGVVKVVKDGRKIAGYQLANIADMQKYLDDREKTFTKTKPVKAAKVKAAPKTRKVKKLADLDAKPVAPVVQEEPVSIESTQDEIEVTEITDNEDLNA